MADFTETVTTTKTVNCPTCASERVVKSGKQSGEQRYLCRGCNRRFRANGMAPKRRMQAEWVGAAIRKYYSGMSYKQIAEYMEDAYDIPEPSKATIYEWVRDYTQAALQQMENHPAHTSGHWVVDEMMLDVGGDKYWNWNVMDHDTRYLLASYLSSERDQASAEAVLRKAAAASDNPPTTVRTDGLPSYVPAVKKIFPDAKHIRSEGMDSETHNNRSERMQGTFRDRTKTMRGLEGRASGQRYLDGWVLQYNLFRDHESLGGKTPGEVAKVEAPFSEWSDITRGIAQKPSESESQEVTAKTNVSQWERQHRDKIRGFRRAETDLVWQSIPVAQVDGNPEKTKVWQSGPAPGLHRGSRYYVARLDDGQLAWVRVSRNWGNLPAVEGKGKRDGLPERNWELEGGRKTRSGNPPRVSQAGYIPLTESGELKPKATAPPKGREIIKEGVDPGKAAKPDGVTLRDPIKEGVDVVVSEKAGQERDSKRGRGYTPKASKSLSGHAPRRGMEQVQNGPRTPAEIRQHQRAAKPHQRSGRIGRNGGGRKKVNITLRK